MCTRTTSGPAPSALCAYCSFREFCPEFGGDPSQAAPVLLARQAEREGRPQLPLVDRVSLAATSHARRSSRFDRAADRAVDRRAQSGARPRSSYPLSSAADHSLLWHACGLARALARGGDLGWRGALLGRDGRRVGC